MARTTELLTVAEVAQICRVHEATVRRHIASGRLRSVRVGRSIRVREEDLDFYVRSATRADGEDREGSPFTADDSLWDIVGMIDDDEPWVAGDKYRALADGYATKR